jgi:hypothetical protein
MESYFLYFYIDTSLEEMFIVIKELCIFCVWLQISILKS